MNKKLKVFIYQEKNGELVKELPYSDVIVGINMVVDHNTIEENKVNLICSDLFPPKNMFYSETEKTFLTKKEIDPTIKRQFVEIIKHVI